MAKKGTEIPTIDVVMVTVQEYGDTAEELALETANQVTVAVSTETQERVPLIVKGVLIAQKPAITTVTGNTITLTDNVFNPELVVLLQGGTITYDDSTKKFKSYIPPVVGSTDKGKRLKANIYSAIYNAGGVITGYEKIQYPNCKGSPVAFNSTDGTFRAPEYTIISAPENGEAPYEISIVDALPTITAPVAAKMAAPTNTK